jgi:hypothetical protein
MFIGSIVCLLLWIAQFVLGIVKMTQGETIHPLVYLCSVLICIMFYFKEIDYWW